MHHDGKRVDKSQKSFMMRSSGRERKKFDVLDNTYEIKSCMRLCQNETYSVYTNNGFSEDERHQGLFMIVPCPGSGESERETFHSIDVN